MVFKHANLIVQSIIYLVCLFQLIQLLIDYTKYDMNNEYRAKDHIEDISFTLCIDQDNLIDIKSILAIGIKKNDIKEQLFSSKRYSHGAYCYSYTNQHNNSYNFISKSKSYILKSFDLQFKKHPFTVRFIAHLNKAPSHFGKIFILKPKNQRQTSYRVQSEYSMRQLLPSPFKHDCHDYSSTTSKFISREYCYLDVMKKLELKYCNVNKYWALNIEYEKNITECIKPNFTLLNSLCKIDCLDISTYYTINKIDIKFSNMPNRFYSFNIIHNDNMKKRLYLEFSPKFTKMQLFSTMGGLLGMWLGLSIDKLISILLDLIFKMYLKLKIRRLKFITKVRLYYTFIIILLMILNLQQLFIEFLSGKTITKFTITNEVYWPELVMIMYLNSVIDCDLKLELNENYTNIKQIMAKNYPQFRNFDRSKIFMNNQYQGAFLKEILHKYGYEYFEKQVFQESVGFLSCTIFDKNGNFIDCKNLFKVSLRMKAFEFLIKKTFFLTPLQQKIDSNNFEKIMIIFNVEKCFKKTFFILENEKARHIFYFNNGTELKINFQKSLLLKSSSSFGETCISMLQNKSYNNHDCKMKFINDYLIHKLKYDCIPNDHIDFYVDDLKLLGNRFCHPNKTLTPYLPGDFSNIMAQRCPLPCENEFLTADIDQKPYPDKIKINLIPKFNLKPIFTHSLSMDYNNFIYDLGGTIGMWIGWSALTMPIYIYEIAKKLSYLTIYYYISITFNIIYNKFNLLLKKAIQFLKIFINLFHSPINVAKNIRSIFRNRVNP